MELNGRHIWELTDQERHDRLMPVLLEKRLFPAPFGPATTNNFGFSIFMTTLQLLLWLSFHNSIPLNIFCHLDIHVQNGY